MSVALPASATPAGLPSRLTGRSVALGAFVVVVVAGLAAVLGPADLPVGGVFASLLDSLPGVDVDTGLTAAQETILWSIRLPRVALGAMVGALLATSGAAYQGVFRNPLADPYLLGAAAGAGLGATLAIAAGGGVLVPAAAFAGAIVAVASAYVLGRVAGDRSGISIILAGVAVAAFFTACQTYVLQRNTDDLREIYSWILGRVATNGWSQVAGLVPYAAVSLVAMILHRRLLDVLAVGDGEAASLGVRVAHVRLVVVIAATLATAAAVAVSGLIGFVGIIVPHTVRLIAGSSNRLVVPLSAVFGAAFLVAADLAARTMLSPAELPIGVVTAFLGAPFFILVLRTSRRPA